MPGLKWRKFTFISSTKIPIVFFDLYLLIFKVLSTFATIDNFCYLRKAQKKFRTKYAWENLPCLEIFEQNIPTPNGHPFRAIYFLIRRRPFWRFRL